MTGLAAHRPTDDEQRNYVNYCVSILDNPTQLWEHAFSQGLGEEARALLLALASMPARVVTEDLETAFERVSAALSLSGDHADYVGALRQLKDSFVRVFHDSQGRVWITALNPSLVDFLRSYLQENPTILERAIEGTAFFEQLGWLWTVIAPPRKHAALLRELVRRAAVLVDSPVAVAERPHLSHDWSDDTERARLALIRLRRVAQWVAEAPALTAEVQEVMETRVAPILDGDLRWLERDTMLLTSEWQTQTWMWTGLRLPQRHLSWLADTSR